ncbi:hypothetical protein [Actinoplanes sp. NPDC051859]|uniref:hypothetical protein n=1 Tax=Actinoplanes sp. NPDC051859 TaxID=3363909 RepID=UPI0037A8937D
MRTNPETEAADWTVLDETGITDIARKAAHSVAAEYRHIAETDDLHQDALILLTTHAARVRSYLTSGNPGYTFVWLRHCPADPPAPKHAARTGTCPSTSWELHE